jgi:nicotinamide-nucleotide adenylyltransferase
VTTGLFVGRFQPFHKGHLETVKFALKSVDTLVMVVGSAQKSHEMRNPFTAGERVMMIKASLDAEKGVDAGRVLIVPVPDVDVHALWTRQVDMLVPTYEVVFANDPFTLLLFRERGVRTVEAPLFERSRMMATEVRRRMAEGEDWQELVPEPVAGVIKAINGEDRVKAIVTQHDRRH